MSLHNDIMNVRARRQKEREPDFLYIAYKEGHRDARHAAAEKALNLEAQRDELREALSYAVDNPEFNSGEFDAIARAALKATEEG